MTDDLRPIAAWAGDRPFCWLDDEPDARSALAAHAKLEVIWVDERDGLQPEHLRRASEWLAALSAKAAS